MTKKIFFISDFFANQITGGGELNDWELMSLLREKGYIVEYQNSQKIKPEMVSELVKLGYKFIVSNFCNLSEDCAQSIINSKSYVICEHDHKYLSSRNPMGYPDYKVPQEEIINKEFYENAKAVFCQSGFHMNILKQNLQIDNLISLGGNLWSTEHLDILEEMNKEEKEESYAVVNYTTPHKNTADAIRYCKQKKINYCLINPCFPEEFLRKLGKNKALVFFPQSPETLSRIVVEARMMGMSAKTTKNIGAAHEEWFLKKGLDLVEVMRAKRKEIPEAILGSLYE
tara:strand:+ start:2564 stop:3418 length:855 start_codon:yes stop_codon:yes gene_type:complete